MSDTYEGDSLRKGFIIDAYIFLRKNNHSIPDDVLDFMKASSIAALETPKPNSEWVSVEFKNIKACSSYYVRDGRGDWFLVYVNKDGEYETGATSYPIEYLNVEGVEILALPQPPKDID